MKSLVTIFFICLASATYSQNEQSSIRKGFVFGTSIGISHSIQSFPNGSQSNTNFGLDAKFGYMIKPTIALLLTTNVSAYDYTGIGRSRKRDFGVLAPSVQYWFRNRFWTLAGIGLGVDAPVFFDIKNPDSDAEETKYHSGFGAVAAIGYEFYKGDKCTIDVKARVTYRNVNITEGNTSGISPSILIGINF